MVALLVAMAVTAIWLGTMLPAWRQQAVRVREADLVFRGNQYARAIALFYVNNECTLPMNVDILVSRHYLRKKWKDPIADDDFAPLVAGAAASLSGTPSSTTQQQTPRPAAPIAGGQAQMVGLYGVSSKSTDTSIMVYKNQQQYSLWSFKYTDALLLMGRAPGCNNQGQPGSTPGTPGKGNPPGGGPPGPGQTVGPHIGLGNGGPDHAPDHPGPPPPGLGGGGPRTVVGGPGRGGGGF